MKAFNCLGYTLTISNFSNLIGGKKVRSNGFSELFFYYKDGKIDKVSAKNDVIDELFNQIKAYF